MTECVQVPHTGEQFYENDILILARFPGTRWVLKKGWYTYQAQQWSGWYFCSIPDGTTLPLNDEDLYLARRLDTQGCPAPGPFAPPPSPGDRPQYPNPSVPGGIPGGAHMDRREHDLLDRAYITVDTIAQRDELLKHHHGHILPNGKQVLVLQVEGSSEPVCYRWNQVTQKWDIVDFKREIAKQINAADIPGIVHTEISKSKAVRDAVKSAADTIVPEVVDEAVGDINERLDDTAIKLQALHDHLKWKELPHYSDPTDTTNDGHIYEEPGVDDDL